MVDNLLQVWRFIAGITQIGSIGLDMPQLLRVAHMAQTLVANGPQAARTCNKLAHYGAGVPIYAPLRNETTRTPGWPLHGFKCPGRSFVFLKVNF